MNTSEVFEDGAWCWFQDPRAVVTDGQLVATSITGRGTVRVATVDLASGQRTISLLRENFDHDDHNVPGLLVRQDGHLMAFYTRHGRETSMYFRSTVRPRDGRAWGPEQSYTGNVADKATYANPVQLSGEAGRIYNFWRGIDFNPTFATSDDNGKSWSDGRNIIYFQKGQRPYVKYASNGIDTVHFAFTEAHPHDRPEVTSLYHGFYSDGHLHRTDGTVVRALAEGPIRPEEATCIYNAERNPDGKAWVWDLTLDAAGHPVVAYTSIPDPMAHRYRYARWDAGAREWVGGQIAFGGQRLYEQEKFYSGGITIDKRDPGVIYLSSNVDIHDGSANESGRYEIYRGRTPDGGASWKWEPITANSIQDNIRPYVPPGHPGGTFLLWMQGTYRTFTNYSTRIMLRR
jgi:hypothetical protein